MSTGDELSRATLERRLERERKARREAESIAERVTAELYAAAQELEHVNNELTGANLELKDLNQAMRDFVAVASHDLRGPLTAILGAASTLNVDAKFERLTPAQRHDMLGVIDRQARHLNRMVEDLLTVSRIEAGELDTRLQVIRLRDAMEVITADFGRDKSDELLVHMDDVRIVADPDHFQRIIVNFLGNAFKYGLPPIEIDAAEAGAWVEIRVRDHGNGVPDDFVPRLFGKFARGEGSVGGTGLGLSIVQGLARANGGETWYEPNTPCGSCFGVRLPLAA
ncbi:MAG: sensor histidine kinase [Actinomycetota bacterium]|nr:HAMP domain-containing histidine kinase [Actinomycetota bacterium]